jgi:AmiR/NasT family two-component response regulator
VIVWNQLCEKVSEGKTPMVLIADDQKERVIQRQLGHADLGVTSVYLQGIDNTEVISAVHSRRAPTMPASAGLLL